MTHSADLLALEKRIVEVGELLRHAQSALKDISELARENGADWCARRAGRGLRASEPYRALAHNPAVEK